MVKTTFPSVSMYEESCACAGAAHKPHIISEIMKPVNRWRLMVVREKQSGRFSPPFADKVSPVLRNMHLEARTQRRLQL